MLMTTRSSHAMDRARRAMPTLACATDAAIWQTGLATVATGFAVTGGNHTVGATKPSIGGYARHLGTGTT